MLLSRNKILYCEDHKTGIKAVHQQHEEFINVTSLLLRLKELTGVKYAFVKDFSNVDINIITETSSDLEINLYYKMLKFYYSARFRFVESVSSSVPKNISGSTLQTYVQGRKIKIFFQLLKLSTKGICILMSVKTATS